MSQTMKAAARLLFAITVSLPMSAQVCAGGGLGCISIPKPTQNAGGSNGNNNGDGNNGINDGEQDAYDHARRHYRSGYDAFYRYYQNRSFVDFTEALTEFQNAIANVKNYGPAEVGLCWLYEEAGQYQKALDACVLALDKDQRRDFDVKKLRKEAEENLLPRVFLEWRLQIYKEQKAVFDNSCAWNPQSAQNGGVVEPSFDVTTHLDKCAKLKAALEDFKAGLDREVAAYNKKHPK